GPLVEATHDKLGFTAPLTAITAAVVGVILNLALFFSYHVFWPEGFTAPFDWWSACIAIAALVGLLHYKRGVIEVITVSAMIGLIVKYLA
ncbi:MAG: chromate transporter, partial [Kordiimonas sp.]